MKSHNRSIISKYPFRFCILRIVKVTAGNHFSDKLLVALSCSEPPEGFARWSLRLLADKVVELGYIDNISHETVRRTLKKRNKPLAKERMGNSPGTKQ